MQIALLGPLQVVTGDGRTFTPPGRQCLLLAALALNAGTAVSADRLIDAVWAGEEPRDPSNALQGRISKLRRMIGQGLIVQQAPGYLLQIDPSNVDAHRFDKLADDGHRLLQAGDLAGARAAFEAGLGLWRGQALDGLMDAPWAAGEATRLEERRLSALEGRITADLESGQGPSLVAELEQLVTEHPFRERFRGQLMLALYRAGRQADALGVFTAGRDVLADELGLDPGAELQLLQAQILEQDPALLLPPPSREGVAGAARPTSRSVPAAVDGPADHNGTARAIRVLVADDDPLVRSAVSAILLAEADLDVVGEAEDGGAAVSLASAVRPDVVLMDVRMTAMDGIEATRRLVERTGDDGPRVIVLTTFEQDEYVYRALKAGASGFLLKRTDPRRLPDAVRTVARGDAILDPSVTRKLLGAFAGDAAPGSPTTRPHETLRDDERSVFDLLVQGLADDEISATLGLEVAAVGEAVRRILATLNARDRTQAVIYAYQHGLVADV